MPQSPAQPDPSAIQLEALADRQPFQPEPDARKAMPELPQASLVSVDDVHLVVRAGTEHLLERLYRDVLGLWRVADPPEPLTYRAANHRLILDMAEPPVTREHLRPLVIEVPSLHEVEHQLIALEIDYTFQRGVAPGSDSLVLLDPGGNWLEIRQHKRLF